MSRRGGFIVGALLLLGLGLLGTYLLSIVEPYDEVVEHGPSPLARMNNYLAAEYFLRKRGVRVRQAESLNALASLPSKGQTLLLLGDRQDMTPRQAERLLEWAGRGGHLVFVAERMWDEEEGESGDLLLDDLGIQQWPSEDLVDDQEAADPASTTPTQDDATPEVPAPALPPAKDTPAEKVPDAKGDADLTRLYLENEPAPAYVGFDPAYHLYDPEDLAHVWANSRAATHLMQLYHGDGLVTVLTDSWIWQNDNIGQYDNAWLLWYLTQDSTVTLLHRTDHDGLGRLLLRHFPQALLALALLILLGLWHTGVRRGPIQQPRQPARRQLGEHLRGSADFLLRQSGQQALLQGLQQDILRRARRRHPGFERLAVAEQWHILGRLSHQPSTAISQAMRPSAKPRLPAAEFTRQVAHLQALRNAL